MSFEAILLGGFVYFLLGFCATIYPDFCDKFEGNLVKHFAVVLAWPLVLAVALFKLSRWTIRRLIVDARALLPVANRPAPPRQVTVAMLAADPEREYVPGLWMKE